MSRPIADLLREFASLRDPDEGDGHWMAKSREWRDNLPAAEREAIDSWYTDPEQDHFGMILDAMGWTRVRVPIRADMVVGSDDE